MSVKTAVKLAAIYIITPDGEYYDLGAWGATVTGLGSTPLDNQSRRGYQQNGETYEATYLRPRTLRFRFDIFSGSYVKIWDVRSAFLDALSIAEGELRLQLVMPNGDVREIKGVVGSDTSIKRAGYRSASVSFSLICHDPTFYDPNVLTDSLTTSASDAFVLPFTVPDGYWFGEGTVLGATINNPGTWRAYPKVTITGGYQRCGIYNATTGAILVLGVQAASYDTIVVDFNPSSRGVWRNGTLSLGEIESGNMINWYLKPGNNTVKLTGSLSSGISATVEYTAHYVAL